jgi:hypothetical protein
MGQLPATYADAALAFAQQQIVQFRDSTNPWSDDSPLTTEASRALMRHFFQAALQHPIPRMYIIEWAKSGEPDAAAALRTLMIEMKSRREELPTELAEYDMWLLLRDGQRHQRPARKKKNNLLRDICIAMTVAVVMDRFGLDPTGRAPSPIRSRLPR